MWLYGSIHGAWGRNGNTSRIYTTSLREIYGSMHACVTRGLYTDLTWENANACATGEFWYSGGGPNPLDSEEVQ
ncbi:hypothetical protein N474_18860 [Pseudoalteromonas luteoviolacea CPMOR-2]|uniref:hypothetical protein n=1 Tax=Pseudoalteromonas luteoviolacea TaxID=43657 RepID=UPI0007B0B4AA|nr:hypothetical protein [Pseudoalteromonas luteoviolacea]KZN53904.1 hypothetical protein N474_18860 [Pseudoalteromonas luteoviolacea CPMOR-2]